MLKIAILNALYTINKCRSNSHIFKFSVVSIIEKCAWFYNWYMIYDIIYDNFTLGKIIIHGWLLYIWLTICPAYKIFE